MTVYEIKVYFDVICAWCYLGHRALTQAITLFQRTYPGGSSDEFRIAWLPFYRDRSLPKEGVSLEQRLVSVFGAERTNQEKARVQRIGRAEGINFTLQGYIGHTRDCHRLIHFAGIKGGSELQQALIQHIYFCWFEIGGDITSLAFLRDCAKDVGMDGDETMELLESDQYADLIDEMDSTARSEGISCVPTYIINSTKFEGTQDVEALYAAFVEKKSE